MKITIKTRRAKVFQETGGRFPFDDYLDCLRDLVGKAKILARVERAEKGNFGDYKHLRDGLFEMRDDFGPGYRIYFGVDGDEIIILLLAGTKREQSRDVEKAHGYLQTERTKRGQK
jgi:putative addiction module killer protein